MLARATNRVHICLRCQRNLARASLNLPGAAESGHSRILRRWQSVATHQLPHEEVGEDHEDTKPSPESEVEPQSTTPSRSNFRRLNFRKWKPKPTAQLGVNSLGKPAEVLLLPTRDRRIPLVPKDEGKEKMLGSTLQESINSENVPLSGQKLAENIEQVRSLVGKMRGQLEKHEWTTLKRHLHSGFQKQQLKKYIRLRKGNLSFPEELEKYNKRDIVKYLVEEVWGFTTPVQDESAASTSKSTKLVLTLHELVKFDHLLMHPSQPLKRIAEELDVQIDVYPTQSKIRTIGSKTNAQQALQRISRYAKNLGQIVIQLRGTHRAIYQDPAMREHLNAYLKSIQRKYQGLSIGMDAQCIRIVHYGNHRGAEQARREILLSVPRDSASDKSLIWPRMDISATTHQPFPTPPEFPALLHHSQWLKLVSTSPSSQEASASTRKDAALAPLLQGLRDAFDLATRTRNADHRQELYYDVAAKFGQALMQELPEAAKSDVDKLVSVEAEEQRQSASVYLSPGDSPGKLEADKDNTSTENQAGVETKFPETQKDMPNAGNDRTSSAAIPKARGSNSESLTEAETERPTLAYGARMKHFVGGGPFLAQHFAHMEPWTDQSSDPSTDLDKRTRAILRLELSPVQTSKDLPTFEMFVTATESVGGQRPRLKVVRVSAIHQEKRFTVLCPHSHMDVQLTQQLKQDLVYPGSSETEIVQLLVNALRVYIGNAQGHGSSDWVFPPFVTLQVHPGLREGQKSTQHAIGQDERLGTHGGAETEGKKSPVAMIEKKQEYILRSVDVVDVDSRLFSVESTSKIPKTKSNPRSISKHTSKSTAKLCLDHITYTGAAVTRQELRLADRPLMCSPTLATPDMPMFLNAALDLAKRLGNDPVKTPPAKMTL
ncbi:uncharacterized protein PV07_09923 [Cladophialophora immunda]|uniref:Uncharacterized protein n=1 Tax=Cladophialophora immunda TaxID=569365 RepID=A0A0D2C139_9EURO|nr:uncharacterized protein PV07_09923 [Cladophialophora immunda]KIW24195.1 hypothetical protein PV07_09923 [Cladophialophora immunda]